MEFRQSDNHLGEEGKPGNRLVFFLRAVCPFVGYALYNTYLLGIDRTQRVIQKRKAGIGMDAVIALLQVLVHIDVPLAMPERMGYFSCHTMLSLALSISTNSVLLRSERARL